MLAIKDNYHLGKLGKFRQDLFDYRKKIKPGNELGNRHVLQRNLNQLARITILQNRLKTFEAICFLVKSESLEFSKIFLESLIEPNTAFSRIYESFFEEAQAKTQKSNLTISQIRLNQFIETFSWSHGGEKGLLDKYFYHAFPQYWKNKEISTIFWEMFFLLPWKSNDYSWLLKQFIADFNTTLQNIVANVELETMEIGEGDFAKFLGGESGMKAKHFYPSCFGIDAENVIHFYNYSSSIKKAVPITSSWKLFEYESGMDKILPFELYEHRINTKHWDAFYKAGALYYLGLFSNLTSLGGLSIHSAFFDGMIDAPFQKNLLEEDILDFLGFKREVNLFDGEHFILKKIKPNLSVISYLDLGESKLVYNSRGILEMKLFK